MGHLKGMRIDRTLLLSVFCLASTMLMFDTTAAEEVVRHPVRPTNSKFVEGKNISLDELLGMLNAKKPYEDFKKDPLRYSKEQTPAYLLENLESCAFSQIRKATVAEAPQARISNFDYVFYAQDIDSEVKKAKALGRQAIGYKPGKHRLDNPLIDARAGWA